MHLARVYFYLRFFLCCKAMDCPTRSLMGTQLVTEEFQVFSHQEKGSNIF